LKTREFTAENAKDAEELGIINDACALKSCRLERIAPVVRAAPLTFAEETAFRRCAKIEIGDLLKT
jgi:hypothetical protein